MVQNAEGELQPFEFDGLLAQVPELGRLDVDIDTFQPWEPVDSSELKPAHWATLATSIAKRAEAYDGFVVLHGTDTMAYTASALSFMLQGLTKPIILTGSQLPIGVLRSDARENVLTAIELALTQEQGQPVLQEVAVYFEYQLYRGNRVFKYSSQDFDAFNSPNWSALADAGVHLEWDRDALLCPDGGLMLQTDMNAEVGILTLFPGIDEAIIRAALLSSGRRVVIVRTYGSGNVPNLPALDQALNEARERGIMVINASQCRRGGVSQPTYQASRSMRLAGAISAGDMTLEAAVVKSMWLLGQDLIGDDFKTKFEQNLCGERSY